MICTRCQEESTDLARKNWCRRCYNAYYRDYYRSRPDKYTTHKKLVKQNDKKLKKNYRKHGLTEDQYIKLLSLFDGMCHACQINPGTNIDHDHACCDNSFSCGRCVRGILCNGCNSALGFTKDSIDRLEKLIKYIS